MNAACAHSGVSGFFAPVRRALAPVSNFFTGFFSLIMGFFNLEIGFFNLIPPVIKLILGRSKLP
jgi:hypothetical protein